MIKCHVRCAGDKQIVADAALDAWALGVVAFELLTRKQAFQLIVQGQDEVRIHTAHEHKLARF